MKILFLDQSGELGGAELCLSDLARHYRDSCQVCTFAPGPFPSFLLQQGISTRVLTKKPLIFKKQSGFYEAGKSIQRLWPLVLQMSRISADYDCIYANTQKALIVGAIASRLNATPLVYHLHDIVSKEHFSPLSRKLIAFCAAQASLVIANSTASEQALLETGIRAKTQVVYNGFNLSQYQHVGQCRDSLRKQMSLTDRFVVGHFSRLSPWKGQHILIEAIAQLPPQVCALLVGDALFGEQQYVQQLKEQIQRLGLQNRVMLLGFRSDIPVLMGACDMVAHTSTIAEPFGRVIVEGMLCDRPVVAAAAGGALEIITHGQTGWLTPPGDVERLAQTIEMARTQPAVAQDISQKGQAMAQQRFDAGAIAAQIDHLIETVVTR